MSHFTVLVITKDGDYEGALAPFDESLEVPEYIRYTREQNIETRKKRLLKEREKDNKTKLPSSIENNSNTDLLPSDEELLKQYIEDNKDWMTFNENGDTLSTYNPNSKWDWYSVGGRWAGSLKIKDLDTIPASVKKRRKEILAQINTLKAVSQIHKLSEKKNVDSIELLKQFVKKATKLAHPDRNPDGINDTVQKIINNIDYSAENPASEVTKALSLMDVLVDKDTIKSCAEEYAEILEKYYPGLRFGEGSWFNDYDIGDLEHCDHAQVKYIDFTPDKSKVEKCKRFWEVVVEGQPLKEHEYPEDFETFWNSDWYIKEYNDMEGYIDYQTSLHTFAILYNGEWIEPGEMGWFGVSTSTRESNIEYRKKFKELINSLDPEDYITMIDCHI